MKKNILVLSEDIEGGEWIATNRLVKATNKLFPNIQFRFLVFGRDIQHSDSNIILGFLRSFYSDLISSKEAIEKKIKRIGEVDYVISTNYILLLAALLVKRLKGIKKVFYFHGFKSFPFSNFKSLNHKEFFVRLLELCALLSSNCIITVSEYSKKYIEKNLWPFTYFKEIFIVPNFIPDDFYRRTISVKKNKNVILYSGRLTYRKGLTNLLEAFNKFSRSNKDTILLFCYPKSSVDKKLLSLQKKYIHEFKLSDKVFLKTGLKQSKLKAIYADSALTILPSELEMAPLSVLESLSNRTPVIGTKVGNIPEILSKIDVDLILKNNSSSEIADKLSWFFSLSSKRLKNIKEKGYKISRSYSSLNSAKKFLKILQSLE